MEQYLVTGGAGFIGSNVVRAILEQGHRVRVLDNLSTGRQENLDGLSGVEFLRGDIRDAAACAGAVRGIDYVIHLAAMISVPVSLTDPLLTHDINVTGTMNMLKAACDACVKRFVYASSSAVYGRPVEGPVREEDAGGFLSTYALTKYADELYADFFSSVYMLPCVGLRYFNVFGPRQDPNSPYAAVIPKFIRAFIDGEQPMIYGDGVQTRDFVFVEDVAAANLIACAAVLERHDVFNIARGESVSINELAQNLAEITGSDIKAAHVPKRTGDVRHSLADISKATRMLGFKPKTALADGLRKTAEWFRGTHRN